MNSPSNLDTQLQELAKRYYCLLEDQLYDPQPHVDGYDKKHQQKLVTNLLRDLVHEATSLIPNTAGRTEVCVFVELNQDGEALCPECSSPLTATVHVDSKEVTPFWHPVDERWEYMVDGGDTYIESFGCPGCGWSAAYVEPAEEASP